MRRKKADIPAAENALMEAFHRLLRRFGPQHWWPGDTPVEIMAGAVLTQNTNWRNVEKAIAELRKRSLLSARRLADTDPETLSDAVRPAGYFRIKARRLSNLFRWLAQEFDGNPENMKRLPAPALRRKMLREVNGVGPETADSILLYALGMPVFVIDAYTRRVLGRHGLPEASRADYEALRDLFETALPPSPSLFNEFHALFVVLGKTFCRKTSPLCGECPLQGLSLTPCRPLLHIPESARAPNTRRPPPKKPRSSSP